MLAYQRLQTIIGREIDVYELNLVSAIFSKPIGFFMQEESTEQWKVEPEPAWNIEIIDNNTANLICTKADELDVSPSEMVNGILKEYLDCKAGNNNV